MKYFPLLFLFLSACATRTLYQPHGQSGGYSEAIVKDDLMVARFSGNAYTHKNDAQLFSVFRAIEICKDKGYRVMRMENFEDNSSSQTVQKSYTYNNQQPTYFSGNANSNTNYNYYGGNTLYSNTNTNVNGTMYGGDTHSNTQTWNETYHYPKYSTYFTCANEISLARVELKDMSAEDIKDFTIDKLGAAQVVSLADDSPNKEIFQVGDIILKVNNQRILNQQDFVKALNGSPNKESIPALVVREGKNHNIKFKAKDFTYMFEQDNLKVITSACTVSEVKKRPICGGGVNRSISSQMP